MALVPSIFPLVGSWRQAPQPHKRWRSCRDISRRRWHMSDDAEQVIAGFLLAAIEIAHRVNREMRLLMPTVRSKPRSTRLWCRKSGRTFRVSKYQTAPSEPFCCVSRFVFASSRVCVRLELSLWPGRLHRASKLNKHDVKPSSVP